MPRHCHISVPPKQNNCMFSMTVMGPVLVDILPEVLPPLPRFLASRMAIFATCNLPIVKTSKCNTSVPRSLKQIIGW